MARVLGVLDHLSVKQRARLARELLHSLDEGPLEDPEVVARAWDDEIACRVDDVLPGRVRSVAWSAVRRDLGQAIESIRRGPPSHALTLRFHPSRDEIALSPLSSGSRRSAPTSPPMCSVLVIAFVPMHPKKIDVPSLSAPPPFRDRHQLDLVWGLFARRVDLPTDNIFLDEHSAVLRFLLWLKESHNPQTGHYMDLLAYRDFRAFVDEPVLEMMFDLLAAMHLGAESIDRWIARHDDLRPHK